MELFIISMLNGVSFGLLLFMLSAGLTLIFSMMGVLNFAHASFYMLGAYVGYTLSGLLGFWPALLVAPLVVGSMVALFERLALRRVHKFGHVAELLITFGLSYVVLELVQVVWGRTALEFKPPESLQGPAFTLVHHAVNGLSLIWGAAPATQCSAVDAALRVVCSPFPLTRGFMMVVALLMLLGLWLLLNHTRIGLVIQAALTHPHMAEALGHNVPQIFMWVFGGGAGLAGLAGVIGGSTYVTEPSMAASVGSIIFVVVVVGGLGSLTGAFLASLLIGIVQTFAVSFNSALSQLAPVLPYLLLVLILIFRPMGLLGKREG
jgi:branched-chain amino acid transport system permease protein